MNQHLLSTFIFLPFLLALIALLIPSSNPKLHKILLSGGAAMLLLVSLLILLAFRTDLPQEQTWMGFQLVERASWIRLSLGAFGSMSVDYLLGIDSLNIAFIPLCGLLLFVATIPALSIREKVKGFVISYFLMAGSIAGCFLALDFFLFFIFFEFMLLPMFFLIGLWGGPGKEKAALKFFLYTLAGSVFILMGMIALYMSSINPIETAVNFGLIRPGEVLSPDVVFEIQQLLAGGSIPAEQIVHTFNIPFLQDAGNLIPYSVLSFESASEFGGIPLRNWCFMVLLIGFLIKLPSVPLHTWLPDAHVEAPTSVSIILAGLLLKVGAYGIFRIVLPVFPELFVDYAYPIAIAGLISILYGALNALGSTDIKRMIAYSSVSHMGFVLIGLAALTAEGLSGSLFQCISHGLISPFLFLIAGIIYERTGTRNRDDLAGMVHPMPGFTVMAMLGFFAALGVPGFSVFIGEFLIITGTFTSAGFNQLIPRWVAISASLGIFLSACYFLYTARKVFFGTFWTRNPATSGTFADLTFTEYLSLSMLLIPSLILGVFPGWLLQYIQPAVSKLHELVQGI